MRPPVASSGTNTKCDSEEARALTKRMPQPILQTDSVQNCLLLLRAVWQSKHASIYKILRELPWPERAQSVVQSYESKRAYDCRLYKQTFSDEL
jgi:hypothetical protein